jgi:hypothetical protein
VPERNPVGQGPKNLNIRRHLHEVIPALTNPICGHVFNTPFIGQRHAIPALRSSRGARLPRAAFFDMAADRFMLDRPLPAVTFRGPIRNMA